MLGDLQQSWGLSGEALGYVTSSVQLGFIAGTLGFAFFTISDRFSPRAVFFAVIKSALGPGAVSLYPLSRADRRVQIHRLP